MNAFDDHIVEFVNRLAQRSHTFDTGVGLLSNLDLAKGGVFMAMVWWAWFRDEEADASRRRSILLSTLLAGVVAVVVVRGLAHALPFRQRPLYTPGFDFVRPYGSGDFELDNWSSFPSDHAVLFFALATGLWLAWRPIGRFAYGYAAIAICLPRIYLGLHWPTDIIAGAAIGIGIAWVATRDRVRRAIASPLLAWQERRPGPFYAVMFVVLFEVATLFDDARAIAHWGLEALRAV